MKSSTLKKTLILTIAYVGMGLAPIVRADHAASFLDPLATELATRLEDTNTSAEDQRALNTASRTLSRNSSTLSADLGLLATAATGLGNAFPEDTTLAGLENDALNNYRAEALAQLDDINNRFGTNDVPPNLNNQIVSAQDALVRANDTSNSIPVRARAVAFALNKIRVANIQAGHLIKAPDSLDGTVITLKGRESDHDAFNVTLNSDHTYTIAENGDEAEENGTWSYSRTSHTNGTLTLSPTGGGSHTLDLKFSNSSKGSFTGETSEGEGVKGRFSIANE
jgi:hypothetical protein